MADVDAVELGVPRGTNGSRKGVSFILLIELLFEILKYWDIWGYIHVELLYPIGSMYVIYGNIYHQYTPNVSLYTNTPWNLPAREVNLLRKLSHGSSVYHEFPPYSAQRITTYAMSTWELRCLDDLAFFRDGFLSVILRCSPGVKPIDAILGVTICYYDVPSILTMMVHNLGVNPSPDQ